MDISLVLYSLGLLGQLLSYAFASPLSRGRYPGARSLVLLQVCACFVRAVSCGRAAHAQDYSVVCTLRVHSPPPYLPKIFTQKDRGSQGLSYGTSFVRSMTVGSSLSVCFAVYFCCTPTQRVPYTENVSPVTDLALVYGTEGFQMGFGFVTVAMPQVCHRCKLGDACQRRLDGDEVRRYFGVDFYGTPSSNMRGTIVLHVCLEGNQV